MGIQNSLSPAFVAGLINRTVSAKKTVRFATVAPLDANTYDNGVDGVGATITIDAFGVLADIDGITPVLFDRVLVKDEPDALKNGFYLVTTIGDGSTSAVLTRSTDADENAEMGVNTNTFVSEGTVNENTEFNLTTNAPIDIGTTDLTFDNATVNTLAEILAKDNKTEGLGIIYDSSGSPKIADDANTTSAMFFGQFLGANVLADVTISPDDGNFGGTSGGELYLSKGNFDEASLYLNGGAAIQAFNFTGSTKGIRLNASVIGITDPIRTSIGHTLILMGGNTDSSTNEGEIVLGVNGAVDVVSDATARQAIIIGSKSSTFKAGVTESLILGGSSITALNSDTVYTTNLVIQETKKLSVDLIGESTTNVGINISGLLLKDNVLHGGVASGDDLTLSSTSNATKGKILFGTSAYDEVNNNLGIGTSIFGTNAVGVLAILNAASPTAALVNGIQIGAKDTVGESTSTLELFLEQVVEAIGTFTPSHKIKIVLNGVEYWIQLDAV